MTARSSHDLFRHYLLGSHPHLPPSASGCQPLGSASVVTFWFREKHGSSTIPNFSVRLSLWLLEPLKAKNRCFLS